MEKKRLTKQEKRAAKYERIKEKRKEKRKTEKRRPAKKPFVEQAPPKYNVCFEILGGKELMTEKEMNSLAQQIRHSYAENRKCKQPVNVSVTNFSLIKDSFPKEYGNWKNFTAKESSIEEEASGEGEGKGKGKVVVLSADSPNTLADLEEDTVYVIGGLVDRNRHKGYVEKKFKDTFPTAKLPISQALTSSTVLSSLHVFQILLSYIETQNWEVSTRKCIPERKQAPQKGKGEGQEEGQGEGVILESGGEEKESEGAVLE
ncbi:tRNA (guanine9-N1)-methyltransferase [Nematocida sp. AWRm77]|nr:tRNA (guanine9-N1)-methyltransferase [Nematocida sp. AWRm77]